MHKLACSVRGYVAILGTFISAVGCISASAHPGRGEAYSVLVDKHDKPITNATYESLSYCGDGIYFGTLRGEHKQVIFNGDGVVLNNPVPPDYRIESIVLPRDKEIQQTGGIPADFLIHVSKAGLHGVLDADQKVVVPVEFDSMNFLGDWYQLRKFDPIVSEPRIYFFDPKSRRLSQTGARASDAVYEQASDGLVQFMPLTRPQAGGMHQWQPPARGYCDIEHKVVIPPTPGFGNPFSKGLAIVRVVYPLKNSNASDSKLSSANSDVRPNAPSSVERNIFIDKTGKFIAPEIIPTGWFFNGLAVASRADSTLSAPSQPFRVGLIDRNFRFVVEPIYESIEYTNGPAFIAKLPGSDHFISISTDGKKLGDFPKEITKIEPGDLNPTNPELVVAQCEAPSFKPPEGHAPHDCIVNLKGEILAPPKYYLQQLRYGLVQVIDRRNVRDDPRCGVMNTKGELVIPLQRAEFQLTQDNRIIKTVQKTGFDPDSWKENEYNRIGIFAAFLDQNNLIGMSYNQLTELLGQGIDAPSTPPGTFTLRYTIMSGSCGNMCNGLGIQLEHRTVKAWRFSGPNEDPKAQFTWYTTNMIFDPDLPVLDCKLVSK